ncbi:MAG: hypothetical protein ACOC7L_01390 [Acidobacteriota bacterium]
MTGVGRLAASGSLSAPRVLAWMVAALACGAVPAAALEGPLGLFPGELFRAVQVERVDDAEALLAAEPLAPAAGLYYFQGEWIAVPQADMPVTGRPFDGPAAPDLPLPPIVWLAAPELVEGARLAGDDRLRLPDGSVVAFDVVSPSPTNTLYLDRTTYAFYRERSLRLRGRFEELPDGGRRFVARTIWPEDARIPWRDLQVDAVEQPATLGDLVQAQAPAWPDARLLWERPGQGPRRWSARPVLAIVLGGAQADAPGSQAGHIAVATGRLGARGEWAHWLANNVYPLDVVGEKGIASGPVPMDNYLADLNAGQALYRPVYALVAVLDDPAAARTVQAAFQELFLAYWCHEVTFDRARHNSTEMSLGVLRDAGWRVPRVGRTSRLKGLLAAIGAAVVTFDWDLVRDAWGFFTEERTDLLPRVAFEVAARDLLGLLEGVDGAEEPPRPLSELELRLREDTDAVLFLRFPQVPSRRPFGTYPVGSLRQYRARIELDEAPLDPTPARERPFPEELRRHCRGGEARP